MIDTLWSDEQTGQLFDWIAQELNANIEYLIAGHSHDDCMETHRRGAVSYALDLTLEKAKQQSLPIPQKSFSDSLTLTLTVGRTKLALRYLDGGHTIDNITVWLPVQKVLFGGCMVRAAKAKGMGHTKEAES